MSQVTPSHPKEEIQGKVLRGCMVLLVPNLVLNFQIYETIHFWYFDPLSLWYFVIAAWSVQNSEKLSCAI